MRDRWLAWLVIAALVSALGWQTMRTRNRLEAGKILAQVEARTLEVMRVGRAPATMFTEHLAWLARAARLDPSEVGIITARGTQFLLMRRWDEAIAVYREAKALEERPEIELNIGRAFWMQGSREKAANAFRRAVQLDPNMRAAVPPDALK